MAAGFEIRALTLGEVLDDAFDLFRRSIVPLILFQLVAFVPTAIAEVVIIAAAGEAAGDLIRSGGDAALAGPAMVALLGGGAVLAIQVVIAPLIGVGLTSAVADTYLSKPWSVKQLFGVAYKYAARSIVLGGVLLVLIMLVVVLPIAVAGSAAYAMWSGGAVEGPTTILLIVVASLVAGMPVLFGAIYINIRYALAFVALVVEDAPVLASLKRSAALMKGRYWSGFGLWLVLFLVGLLLGFAASLFAPAPAFETLDPDQLRQLLPQIVRSYTLRTVLGEAMGMFTRTFAIIAWTLFYFSSRCQAEGFDLVLLAERFSDKTAEVI